MRYFVSILIIIVLIAVGYGWSQDWFAGSAGVSSDGATSTVSTSTTSADGVEGGTSSASSETADGDTGTEADRPQREVIGTSVEGREITAHHYGNGSKEIVLVGGIHAGYSWNTVLLSRELMELFEDTPSVIPDDITMTVIPLLNPDGLYKVAGTTGEFDSSDLVEDTTPGRFNANGVDLSRNFDCNWKSTSKWRDTTVDAGSAAFSEPEAETLRDYVIERDPHAAVVYYSSGYGIYTSNCNDPVAEDTTELMNTYSEGADYPARGEFTAYDISGDAVDWLAKRGIPAISVLFESHERDELAKNREGLKAIMKHYSDREQ